MTEPVPNPDLAPFKDVPMGAKPTDNRLLRLYRRDGFLVHDFGFSKALIDECADVTESYRGDYLRVQDLWRRNKAVRTLASHPAVLAFLNTIFERRPFPFQTLNFPVGTEQHTHADTFFFNSYPERYMCGVWVALEDIDMENGPLHYYKGSHRQPVMSKAQMEAAGFKEPSAYFAHASRNYEKQYGIIKKGEAVIWSANVLHGGEPIKDKTRSRLSQVTHYYFDDCVYFSPVLSNPEIGQMQVRRPYDIAEKRLIESRYKGKKVPANILEQMVVPYYNLTRRVPKWK